MTRAWNLIAGVTASAAAAVLCVSCSRGQPPSPASLIPPISGPQPIDGTYGGVMQLYRGDEMSCGNTNEFRLQVVNHAFTYRLAQPQVDWRPTLVFTAAIAPDGTVDATAGGGSMSGTLKDGHMHGRIIGDVCGFTFDADRNATF